MSVPKRYVPPRSAWIKLSILNLLRLSYTGRWRWWTWRVRITIYPIILRIGHPRQQIAPVLKFVKPVLLILLGERELRLIILNRFKAHHFPANRHNCNFYWLRFFFLFDGFNHLVKAQSQGKGVEHGELLPHDLLRKPDRNEQHKDSQGNRF